MIIGKNDTSGHQEMEKNKDALSDPKMLIKSFIDAQVVRRGLDWRTGEAYRIDLEHFYKWLAAGDGQSMGERAARGLGAAQGSGAVQELGTRKGRSDGQTLDDLRWQEKMEDYLEYLTLEKRLRPATVARKYRVFNYYLAYLVRQGLLLDRGPLRAVQVAGRPRHRGWDGDGPASTEGMDHPTVADGHAGGMSKKDVDAFFLAMERECSNLDSDFRKRICLRDRVMMALLFYHGIEVSELLRLEVSDYDQGTGVLTVPKKRGRKKSIYLYSRTLREQLERWISMHGSFEREPEYQRMLFLSKLGKPLSMKMVINIFEKYRELAGIEKAVTPKDLKRCMGEYARELMREWCE